MYDHEKKEIAVNILNHIVFGILVICLPIVLCIIFWKAIS